RRVPVAIAGLRENVALGVDRDSRSSPDAAIPRRKHGNRVLGVFQIHGSHPRAGAIAFLRGRRVENGVVKIEAPVLWEWRDELHWRKVVFSVDDVQRM